MCCGDSGFMCMLCVCRVRFILLHLLCIMGKKRQVVSILQVNPVGRWNRRTRSTMSLNVLSANVNVTFRLLQVKMWSVSRVVAA